MNILEKEYEAIDDILSNIHNATNNFLFIDNNSLIAKKMITLGLVKIVYEYRSPNPPITFNDKGQDVLTFGKGYKAYFEEINRKTKRDKLQYNLLVITSISVFVAPILEVWLPIQDKCLKSVITGILLLMVLSILLLISKKRN